MGEREEFPEVAVEGDEFLDVAGKREWWLIYGRKSALIWTRRRSGSRL